MPSFPNAADTTGGLKSYVFTALRQRISEHPGPLFRLHIGDTYLDPVVSAQCESLRTAELEGLHRYAPVQGLPMLLDAIERKLARRTGVAVPRANLQVTAGATGGLSITCQALLDVGDEVLLPSPFWPLSSGIVAARGGKAVQIPFYDKLDDPNFDVEATLEAAVTPRTVAIYLNSPNNPTGAVIDDEALSAISRVAARHDLWIFSDEVYEDLWLGDDAPAPLWTRDDFIDRTVVIHSMSKGYGLAGARVGYIHGPDAAMAAIRAVQTFHTYCAAKPMQIAAARALDEGDGWLTDARQRYRAAGEVAAEALGVPLPAGGTFLFFDASPWLDADDADVMPLLHRCLDAGVIVTPGGASGDAYQRWMRVCFTCVAPDELRAGLGLLQQVLGRS
ncbi:MAG: pyridoxal phosphate-dependent aminotransferase [Myxococcota bacterium]